MKYEFSTVYRRGNRIRLNDLPKATQLENGGRRLWVQTSRTTKFIHFYLEQGKKWIPLNEDWYISAMLMREGWLQWYQCRCERNTAGMSQTFLSETRQYRKGRTTNFHSSDVWENCLWWWKRPMSALSHVAASHHISYAALTVCGGRGLWRDFVSSLPNRLDSFSLLFTRWAGVALPVVSFLSQSKLFLI